MAHGSVPSALTEYMLILTRKKIKYQAVLQALYGENPWDGNGNNNNNQNCRNNRINGNLMFSTASNQNLSLEIAHEIEQDQIDDYDNQNQPNNQPNNQINYPKVQKPQQLPISPLNVQEELSVVNYSQIDQDDQQQGHTFMLDGEFNMVDMDLLSPE
jgi:hypothetical protein